MSSKISKLSGLIIGGGSIGERHLHNLKKLKINNIAIVDSDKKKLSELSQKYSVKTFSNLDSALTFEPDFSVICTYPSSHYEIAKLCLKENSHVFIEKPISTTQKGIKNLLKFADKNNLKVCVGYNFRFDPGLQYVKFFLNKLIIGLPLTISVQSGNHIKFWRPELNYKNHYILKKGGGIVLDGSHEYDYVRWILNDEVISVYSQTNKTNSIKSETESIAAIILKFKKGTIATFLLDYVRPKYERSFQIIGEKGSIKWSYLPKKSGWKNYSSLASSKVVIDLINKQKSEKKDFFIQSNRMYLNEIQNFLNSIIYDIKPTIDGWDGYKTLQLGDAILKSAKENSVISL